MDVQETPPDIHDQQRAETVQIIEQTSQTLVVKTDQQAMTHHEEASKIIQIAEKDARKLLDEAETHESVKIAVEEAKSFGAFWLKFLNDWVFNFASGLAYHLLTAMFPIVIALLIIVGFISGG